MLALIIICLLIAVIIIGYKTRINIGLLAIVVAYLVGITAVGVSPKDLVGMWPTKLFFLLFSVTFFYGFAMINGTLKNVALKVIYLFRTFPWLMPIVIYLLTMILAGIGAGQEVAVVIFIPIAMTIASVTGMSPILGGLAAFLGGVGGFAPISMIGILIKGLIETAGYSAVVASTMEIQIMKNAFIYTTILFCIFYFVFKGYKSKVSTMTMEKPEPFTGKQKITLIIIGCFVGVLVIPFLINALVSGIPFIVFLTKNVDVGFVSIICATAALLFKVADEKEVLAHVPWKVLIMLSGVSILIGVVVKAGAVQLLSNFVSVSTSSVTALILAVAAGFLSLFVSGLIVNAAFFPIVPVIVTTMLALSPVLLFSAIALGGFGTAISPFSTAGGLVLASIEDEKTRDGIFKWLLVLPFINLVIFVLLIVIGIVR